MCYDLTGQKRGVSELKLVWPVILTSNYAAVIFSPATWQNALLSTSITFYNIFVWTCAEIKILISKFLGEKVTYVFRLFVFNFNFFLSFFLLFLSFCCSYWPSTGRARKAILSQEILPWVFHSNFWPFSCIFQAPSSRSLWSGYHWKDLFFLQNLNRWCHFQSKAIKSDVEQRLRLITVGYCWHRSQWVKDIK